MQASDWIQPRIGGSTKKATNELHSVIVMVERADLAAGIAGFGGGCIVSRTRVLTAASVVRGATKVHVGFYNARFEANRFRRATAEFILPQTGFNTTTHLNDLAVLSFADNTFPAANVISVAIAAPTGAAIMASYGFTAADVTTPNQFPLLADHTVATCTEIVKTTTSHFCAGATSPAVVCPGDNGSGLFTDAEDARRLIGIASIINSGCVVDSSGGPTLVGFTNLSSENTQNFLRSQGIVPVA